MNEIHTKYKILASVSICVCMSLCFGVWMTLCTSLCIMCIILSYCMCMYLFDTRIHTLPPALQHTMTHLQIPTMPNTMTWSIKPRKKQNQWHKHKTNTQLSTQLHIQLHIQLCTHKHTHKMTHAIKLQFFECLKSSVCISFHII